MASVKCKIVELCVFKIVNNRPFYLLLHRTKDEKIFPNIWQFITGSIEKNETAVNAALRELKEEIGLKPKAFWTVPFTFSFYDTKLDVMNQSPFFAAEVNVEEKIKLSKEHDKYGWFTYTQTIDRLIMPSWRSGLQTVHNLIVPMGKPSEIHRII